MLKRTADDTSRFTSRLRDALGTFTTGVTVITTRDEAGRDVGLTVNSFNSVSLDPPMVLWSLAKTAHSLPAFMKAQHFAVHILAADQTLLSNRFAQCGVDKFLGMDVQRGVDELPLLAGCAARFECKTMHRYEGGDHTIFVGEVLNFVHDDRPPLVFQRGTYATVLNNLDAAA